MAQHGVARASTAKRVGRVLALVLLVLLLLGAWAGWQLWQGVQALQSAAAGVRAVELDPAAVEQALSRLEQTGEQTREGRARLDDPVVRAVSALPVLGEPVAGARAAAQAADVVVREALLPLLIAAGPDAAERLTSGPGAVDVDYLASLAQPATEATQALARASAALAAAPSDTIVDRVDEAVRDFAAELAEVRPAVEDAALAARVAPELLGREGTQRYLVVSQSPAEARGTGGLVGGYSLVEVEQGAMRIVRSGPRSELRSADEPVVDLGAQFQDHYGLNGGAAVWVNSNLSPHFPYAAQVWLALWERQYGEQLDGAVVLDPIALSYLLEATGPVTLPDGTQVTAANVADLTLRDVYARYPRFTDETQRDSFLQQVSTAVAAAVTTRELPGKQLLTALRKAVAERRLLLWSADEELQQQLQEQPVSGTLPTGPAVGSVVVDAIGSKLDYYLERDLRYDPGCGDGPSTLTLELTNAAPASGLPEYVTPGRTRHDDEPPGFNRMLVTLYLPPGVLLNGLTVAGEEARFRKGTELGLEWVEVLVGLLPGQGKEVTATFTEPAGADGQVERFEQPLVRPETFTAGSC